MTYIERHASTPMSEVGAGGGETTIRPPLEGVFLECRSGVSQTTWHESLATFMHTARTADIVDPVQARTIRGYAARLFEDAYYAHRTDGGRALQLGDELEQVLSLGIPAYFDVDVGNIVASKRQPTFMESVRGTIERFDFMEQLPEAFRNTQGIMIGGSMNYGPFFNVREGGDCSDIDAIGVVDSEQVSSELSWAHFLNSEAITDESKEVFLGRISVFGELHSEGKADVLSQRFDAANYGFNMSAHFFPRDTFEQLHTTGLGSDLEINEDTVVIVRDFKPRRFERPAVVHNSFDGNREEFVLPEQQTVRGGFVAQVPAYAISSGRYYPGLYQCLALPEPLIWHDTEGTLGRIYTDFHNIVEKRLSYEQGECIGATLLSVLPRAPLFAPGRYD